jgi:hypothetical protein
VNRHGEPEAFQLEVVDRPAHSSQRWTVMHAGVAGLGAATSLSSSVRQGRITLQALDAATVWAVGTRRAMSHISRQPNQPPCLPAVRGIRCFPKSQRMGIRETPDGLFAHYMRTAAIDAASYNTDVGRKCMLVR